MGLFVVHLFFSSPERSLGLVLYIELSLFSSSDTLPSLQVMTVTYLDTRIVYILVHVCESEAGNCSVTKRMSGLWIHVILYSEW